MPLLFAKRTVPYLVDYSYEILYNYIQIRLGSKQENRSSMRDNRNNNRNNINKANNSKSDNGIRINKFLSDAVYAPEEKQIDIYKKVR